MYQKGMIMEWQMRALVVALFSGTGKKTVILLGKII
jgi:hypothetical protein